MDYLKQSFAQARVLVVGDVILDRYWHGNTQRISPEAPVPVVHVTGNDERPGGAANVALNIRSLGAHVALIGVTGQDKDGEILVAKLLEHGVDCRLLQFPDVQTIVKLRVLSQHQQLIRLDFEDSRPKVDRNALKLAFARELPAAQVVVLSDYAKGTLMDSRDLIGMARDAGKRVIVDPKDRDLSRYAGAAVITPNLREFEEVVGACEDDETIASRARELCERHQFDAVLVTRGEHGMSLIPRTAETVHLPAHARDVYDVTGAGDTVCGVLAAALAAGHDLVQATALANTAAGIVVGKLGAASVTPAEMESAMRDAGTHGNFGVLGEEQLLHEVRAARLRGERIVMTNGCFDILHAGHVRYLQQARDLGDRLIVAVNDDDSVRRLKGVTRPITPLAQRMEVVAALASVDWVTPFTEDTPQRLICRIAPDVLVKGGDYRPEQVAGSECVRERGGRVVVLEYIAGCSTTRIIDAAGATKAAAR
jgi:D-beta-D-heptose 7-phosphate kinase/D-beta-D-heptose 1-phosphate adenosyltransferase